MASAGVTIVSAGSILPARAVAFDRASGTAASNDATSTSRRLEPMAGPVGQMEANVRFKALLESISAR